MLKQLVKRAAFGMVCALLLVSAVAAVQAAPNRQDPPPEAGTDECLGCHEGLRDYWGNSAHATALEDPVFQEAWAEAGNDTACLQCHTTGYDAATGTYKQEGVTCLACHYPVVGNHPDRMMPTDVSARLCANCHLETFEEWEQSNHGEADLTCSNCHNPHTTALRNGSSEDLCQNCHGPQSDVYMTTTHAQNGMACVECHLEIDDTPMGEGHGKRSHTFIVGNDTCQSCHNDAVHNVQAGMPLPAFEPVEGVPCPRPATEIIAATPVTAVASQQPPASSPLIYALPAGFGLVFGVLVAPWFEGKARRRGGK